MYIYIYTHMYIYIYIYISEMGIHYRGVQWEGGAVDGDSII